VSEASCPLCEPDPELVFYRGALVLGLWDAFPASDGHPFLVTKRQVPSSNSVPDGGALSSQDIRHRPEKISTFALDKICRAFLDEAQMRSRMPLRFVQIAYETTIPSIEAQKPSRPKFVEHRPSQGASEPQCYKRVYTTNEISNPFRTTSFFAVSLIS